VSSFLLSNVSSPGSILINIRDDCEIQFRDNKTLKKATETLSVQKLFEFYSRGADRALYITDHCGTAKLPTGPYLWLEVFINIQKVSYGLYNLL
jgi:hypothetical protein